MIRDMHEIAIKVITKKFDEFIGECLDESGQPKMPSRKSLYRARGYLPFNSKNTLIKKE